MESSSGFLPMAWSLAFLLVSTCPSGSSSQPVLTQSPSASFSPGETVRLSCALSSGHTIGSYRVRWYQKKPDKAIQFVYQYYNSNDQDRGSGVPERFSVSPDASKNLWNLVITGVQAEDEADYHCSTWHSSSTMYVFGGGTYLNVPGQSPVPPKVHLFPPSQQEIESKNKATLACLVDEFYPKTIEVNWQADGKAISSGVQTSPSTKQGEKYMATSYLILSKSEWDSHETYACKVTHDGKTFEQVVKKSDCP